MSPAKPKVVYLLVDTPDRSAVVQQGQRPTTMACYSCPIDGTVEDTVKANWHHIPIGSTVLVTTDAKCDGYVVKPTLEPAS